jgi:hypothetical protein
MRKVSSHYSLVTDIRLRYNCSAGNNNQDSSEMEDIIECTNCGDPASVFCEQCSSHYCGQCSLLAHKHPKRKDHTLKKKVEKESYEGMDTMCVAKYFI